MPASHPLVSIIIPAYNQAQYLRQAVDSALAQTYPHYEIIVVDDGSTDETAAIAKSYGDQICYVYQENRGLAGARNTGIRTAQGEWIGLLDSDDIWLPDYLESIITLARQNPAATVLYARAACMDTTGQPLPQIVGGKTDEQNDLYTTLLQANFLIPSTITMRRDPVVQADYFDQSLRSCEDWDLWLRMLPAATFIGTTKVLVRYRVHEQSLSANVAGMHAAKQAVIEKQFGRDNGQYASWIPEKRTAYSGLYRYFLITAIQRGGQWQAGIENLFKSLQVDPSRAADVDLFYELALGIQPVGYRGSTENIDIATNTQEVITLLENVFQREDAREIGHLKHQVYGTAYYAMGLAAYNTGQLKFSRKYLWRAGIYRPSRWLSANFASLFLKSLLGNAVLDKLRHIKNKVNMK